jgi:hypothetical protein
MVFSVLTSRSLTGRPSGLARTCRLLPLLMVLSVLCIYNRRTTKSFREAVSPRSDWMGTGSATGTVRSSWKYASSLPLNPECSIIQNLQGVYHDPTVGAIRVVLHDNPSLDGVNETRRACLRPYLIARLSGPAVGLVEQWSYGQIDSKTTFVEGYYHVPTTGSYFLEIIVILCNKYDDNLLLQAQQYVHSNQSDEADAAFERERQYIKQFCLEPAMQNRLTAYNTSIEVAVASRAVEGGNSLLDKHRVERRSDGEGYLSRRVGGFWERNKSFTQQHTTDQTLYTRYEALECWTSDVDGTSDDDAMCDHPAASTKQFEPYRFSWTLGEGGSRRILDERHLIDKVRVKSEERQNDTLCLVGDSHVHSLWADHLPKYVANPLVISSIYLASTFGANFSSSQTSDNITKAQRVKHRLQLTSAPKMEQCSYVLIQIASWDAGWLNESPLGISLYEQNMLKTIQNFQLVFPSAALYVWSPHSTALGLANWICPQGDWRSPPLIDAYKTALQRVVAAAASPLNPTKYLDTSFITQPLWDYTCDWSHSAASVSDARALFIAATLLDVF